MSSETLRRAAAQIRKDFADDASTGDYLCETMLAVADWLDRDADRCDQLTRVVLVNTVTPGNVAEWQLANAFKVATAYLGPDEVWCPECMAYHPPVSCADGGAV